MAAYRTNNPVHYSIWFYQKSYHIQHSTFLISKNRHFFDTFSERVKFFEFFKHELRISTTNLSDFIAICALVIVIICMWAAFISADRTNNKGSTIFSIKKAFSFITLLDTSVALAFQTLVCLFHPY